MGAGGKEWPTQCHDIVVILPISPVLLFVFIVVH
jgi:hypothetical protein